MHCAGSSGGKWPKNGIELEDHASIMIRDSDKCKKGGEMQLGHDSQSKFKDAIIVGGQENIQNKR
jgi:hypothetical protein